MENLNPYMSVSLATVADHITREATATATAIRTTDEGLDPEVDVMVMIRALYQLASSKGMFKVAESLEEAFNNAYDAFFNNNFVDSEPYDDEHTWM